MEKGVIEIKKCPLCDSKERYVEELTKQAKEDGTVGPEAQYCAHIIRNTVPGPSSYNQLPVGTTIATYEVWFDVCLGYPDRPCGNIYAIKLVTSTATKRPALVKPGGTPNKPFSSN